MWNPEIRQREEAQRMRMADEEAGRYIVEPQDDKTSTKERKEWRDLMSLRWWYRTIKDALAVCFRRTMEVLAHFGISS